ncbi:MAG: L-seryl-tRNA(Sec) selenium transferase [Synergistaceae bacterium]|nr:L-seryl-tRNA(Sec) selenium transferase [Synergistota bacterium]NLM70873.1 L-seryl-tRNA(Sec) selenium transferase [Synergistaceae bacterium]
MRSLPSMDVLLNSPLVTPFFAEIGRDAAKSILGSALSSAREELQGGELSSASIEEVLSRAIPLLKRASEYSLVPVVNATGVVVHTNLGRSCLADEAADSALSVAKSYSTLEYDLDEGRRGSRTDHVEWLLRRVTGAEAAIAVNNNAGAVLLSLAALCKGKEVVVSRGELVEIGGSFRIPEIMEFSGVRLVEVGSTNRTHRHDYERAIGPDTAALLKVHPSNFRMEGFVCSPSREELASLAEERGLYFIEDLGSGTLLDLSQYGLSGEPTVGDCLRGGVHLVTFSGDKLLGGPQIGGAAGRKELVEALRSYPLHRALRVDKMTLAAFEATLRLYLRGEEGVIPTIAMLSADPVALRSRAEALRDRLKVSFPQGRFALVEVEDAVGGGAFPAKDLPGWGVALSMPGWGGSGRIQKLLRKATPPVVAGAREDEVLIHVRTLLQGDEERIEDAFGHVERVLAARTEEEGGDGR